MRNEFMKLHGVEQASVCIIYECVHCAARDREEGRGESNKGRKRRRVYRV